VPPPESARTSTRPRKCRGSCARARRAAAVWSAAVFDPAFPGRSTIASGSAFPVSPWSAVTRAPPTSGAASPASAQARSRDAARADRMPSVPAAGPPPGSRPTGIPPGRTRPARPGPAAPAAPRCRPAVPAGCDSGGQVRDDLARVVDRPRRPPPGQVLRQAPAQAGDPHRLPQQHRPGVHKTLEGRKPSRPRADQEPAARRSITGPSRAGG
jgi:translation initiation factor IF-2